MHSQKTVFNTLNEAQTTTGPKYLQIAYVKVMLKPRASRQTFNMSTVRPLLTVLCTTSQASSPKTLVYSLEFLQCIKTNLFSDEILVITVSLYNNAGWRP